MHYTFSFQPIIAGNRQLHVHLLIILDVDEQTTPRAEDKPVG